MTSVEKADSIILQSGACNGIDCDSSESNECPCYVVCAHIDGSNSPHPDKVKACKKFLLEHAAEEASTLPLYSDTQQSDPVNHPDHYTSGGLQCWDAIEASMTHEAFCGYLKGNVQKYIWRYEKKVAPVEDLRKAAVYLNKLIEEVENGSNSN